MGSTAAPHYIYEVCDLRFKTDVPSSAAEIRVERGGQLEGGYVPATVRFSVSGDVFLCSLSVGRCSSFHLFLVGPSSLREFNC